MSTNEIQPAVLAALIAASAALGTALFAFIAALINARTSRKNAVLQAVIAQRVKRADFRQAWINQLRDAFIKTEVAFMLPNLDREGAENSVRLLLLMNRADPDYEILRSIVYILSNKTDFNDDERNNSQKEFIIVSQKILKREWEVIKTELNHLEDEVIKKVDC